MMQAVLPTEVYTLVGQRYEGLVLFSVKLSLHAIKIISVKLSLHSSSPLPPSLPEGARTPFQIGVYAKPSSGVT